MPTNGRGKRSPIPHQVVAARDEDPAQNAYLEEITKRLLAGLPPTTIHFRVVQVDSGEINGVSLAGGRIYITRKLVASAQSEDEAASDRA